MEIVVGLIEWLLLIAVIYAAGWAVSLAIKTFKGE